MSISNLDYQFNCLTSRYRNADGQGLLKRFLSFFGEQLDKFDQDFETLYQKVKSETAPEQFVEFWCWSFFGWSWFPSWWTLPQKQAFYGDLAKHLARRGTKAGIEGFLRAFGVHAVVFNRPEYWGSFYWGASDWTMTGPLALVVRVYPMRDVAASEMATWGEFFWQDAYFAPENGVVEQSDVEALLRFQAPLSQDIYIEYLTA
jgi:phage tail-like protein